MNKNIKAGADIHAGDGGYSEGTLEQYDALIKVRNKSLAQGRIRDLAEQATTYIEPTANSGEGWIFDKEKFAELIVRECINAVNSSIEDENTAGGLTWDTGFIAGVRCARHNIKQHFGVEE